MSELFAKIGQWFANYASEFPLQDWLVDLIKPIIDLFKNLSK
jgi:hypothetical protein